MLKAGEKCASVKIRYDWIVKGASVSCLHVFISTLRVIAHCLNRHASTNTMKTFKGYTDRIISKSRGICGPDCLHLSRV